MKDFHIQGKYHFSNGDMYEGMILNDKFDSQGIFIHANGSKYEGEVLN